MYFVFEIIGTISFAISGAMTACQKKMDILGVIIMGVTTAIGGGIIRDVLLGITPPQSLRTPLYATIAIVVSIIVFFPFIRSRINTDSMFFVVIDALGLGAFTVIGFKTAFVQDNLFFGVFFGVLTGVGGGVLRDVFAAEKPVIFVKRFYAAASICGAIVCRLIYPYSDDISMVAGIAVIVVLRYLAAKYRWHLPRAN